MKKVGIVTINGNSNFGNRLQNYALLKTIEKLNFKVETVWIINDKRLIIKNKLKKTFPIKSGYRRFKKFLNFTDKYLNVSYYPNNQINDKYDFFVAGSDQIWNYNFPSYSGTMFLDFSDRYKNISYAASIGVNQIAQKCHDEFTYGLENFKNISVREDTAKILVEELTGRNDVEVLVDPTLLLIMDEWDKILQKPKKMKNKKYILNYFLGNLSKERSDEINRIAQQNDCEIINMLDKQSKYYECGPSEFLYLEKNAFLICTDSFHSCVFAMIFNRPFIIFDREDNNISMNSRIDTLINTFKLKNRRYVGYISPDNLKHDYTEAYQILEKERLKSQKFLKKALNIEE